ncbi:MAG TPA: DUF4230 domain-containing protein [Chthoniobacterales bacterium]|jgi:hypothetical protein|nr:DUF4230 domain-containing protein [Chthoniobacterales bacterium]
MTRSRFSWPLAFVLVALIGAALVYFIFDRLTSWPERAIASFTHESAASVAKLRDVLADTFQFRPRVVVKDKVFYESSQEVMQLTVLTKDTQVMHESDQTWLGSTKHIRIRATFRLHAGFDLDKECLVSVKGTTVTVTLPPAKILSTEVIHWEVEELQDGLWNKIQPQDVSAELNALPKIAEAQEPELAAEAQRAFERELSDKLKPLGYQAKVQTEANEMTNNK